MSHSTFPLQFCPAPCRGGGSKKMTVSPVSIPHIHPCGNFSSSKPLFLISSLFSWVNTLIACVGHGYYGLSPFPLHRNLLPTLLPLPDSWFILFAGDEAWPTVSAAPASCRPGRGDADLCQPGSRSEEEDCRSGEVEMSTLTSVKTGRRNHENGPRIISASGQRLEGPQWRQERTSNGVKWLSSLFASLLHKPVPADTEPPPRLCRSKSGRCWLSKGRMYWLVISSTTSGARWWKPKQATTHQSLVTEAVES